jgi:uncharacterized protein
VNRLADETSPYLRQHADNPVDWHPWGPEAMAEARRRDVPVFLSIGYSSCHWCHVMAHESFEDPALAAVLNAGFVSVKVDREERPDVDAVYMEAVQALTGRGGWPLSAFLDHDGRPFFAGTYFPDTPRPGMPSFRQILDAITEAWTDQRDELAEQAASITAAIADSSRLQPSDDELHAGVLDAAVATLVAQHDRTWGGFGRAPKFPQAMSLRLLAGHHARTGDPDLVTVVETSLDAMASGGIHDQLGGGFARYSVDQRWLVPHFEKMLYDQALLLRAYLAGWRTTGHDRHRRVVEGIVGYVAHDLARPGGGVASAEDADSEGHEGTFYVWTPEEIRAVCGADADAVLAYYGVTPGGNFEGRSILHVAERAAPTPEAVERCRPALLERRSTRVRPGLDDKVLTAWNALWAAALAEAAAALGRPDWLDMARTTTRFLLAELRDADGRLLRSWQDGRARHLAVAEDHAALLELLVTLAEVDDVAWLEEAERVADELVARFHDPEHGGFFTTAHDAERLVVRAKDLFDNATPSAGSLAADGLLRLGALTGEGRWEEPALGVLRLVRRGLEQAPSALAHALVAVDRVVHPPLEVAVVGDPGEPATAALLGAVWGRELPGAVRLGARPGTGAERTPLLADRGLVDGRPTAYVCSGFACERPVTDDRALAAQLDAALTRGRADAAP